MSKILKRKALKALNIKILLKLRWVYVFVLTVKTALSWNSKEELFSSNNLYSTIRTPLKVLLASAGLEVIHAVLRIVPSNPAVVFPQVFIRFLVIWGVAENFASVQLKFRNFSSLRKSQFNRNFLVN